MFSISQEPRGGSLLVWLAVGIGMALITEGLIRSIQNVSTIFGTAPGTGIQPASPITAGAMSTLGVTLFFCAMSELMPTDPKLRVFVILNRVVALFNLLVCIFQLALQGIIVSVLIGAFVTAALALSMWWRTNKLAKP